ncbi:MAG: hypothetical protein V3V74_07445 [Nitrosomonadaceae bacterium]
MGTFKPNSTGATASRPVTPDVGWTHWNTTISAYEVWTGSIWFDISTATSVSGNARFSIVEYTGDGLTHRRVDHGFGVVSASFVMIVPLNTVGINPLIAVNHDTTTSNVGVFSVVNSGTIFDAHTNPVNNFSWWNGDPELIRVGVGGASGNYNTNSQLYRAFFIV